MLCSRDERTELKNDRLNHYHWSNEKKKTNFLLIDSHLVFTGQAPAVCSDSSILLLHVGLHLSVLGSLLLFTRWWTALVHTTGRAKRKRVYTLIYFEGFWLCISFHFPTRLTHSSFRKSKVLDFSVGNWEKVLLLFTRLPGALYFMLDWESTFFMTGELEEELNSLLKLQVARLQKAKRGNRADKECREEARKGGHQPTGQLRKHHQHLL